MSTRMGRSEIEHALETALVLQESELAEARERQTLIVVTRIATGSGDIDHAMALDRKFRLVFIRCHFAGTSGTAPFRISVDSVHGSAYDTRLFTISQAGADKDVHLRIGGDDAAEPSAWTFQTQDAVRIQWANPDNGNITWGLEVGLAVAS